MKHNPTLRIVAFFVFTLIVFLSAYFIGNFAPVVKSGEVVKDTFNATGTGAQIFGASLKQGENQCLITMDSNATPETERYLYVLAGYTLNNTDSKVAEQEVSNYEGTFNITSKGVNEPVVINITTIDTASWSIQCAKV